MSAQRSAGVYQPRSRRGQIADAIASFRDWLRELVAETLRRALGLALAIVGITMIAALASYDSADPSFNVATGRGAGNWLGATGAYTADLLFQMFGLAALALVATVGAWGWQTFTGKRLKQSALRVLALVIGALFLAAGLGALTLLGALPAGPGGIPGRMALFFTAKTATAFSAPWLSIVIPMLFASFGAVLIFVAAELKTRTVLALGQGAFGLAHSAAGVLARVTFPRRARDG